MRAYAVALVAACSLVGSGAIDILEGPEFIDTLLPEVAHVFGTTASIHTTLDEMNLRAEDVYVLPRAPKIEDCLSALEGMPLTRQPKPFSDSMSLLDVKPYETAQLKIAEARAAELAAAVAPLVAFAPTAKYGKGISLASIEIAPGQYRSLPYAVIQGIVYAVLVPGALFGIRNAKSTAYIKKALPLVNFFTIYSVIIIILQNVFAISSMIALPIALVIGLLSMLFALRSLESVQELRFITSKLPYLEGQEKEPIGWLMCMKVYVLVLANLLYHVLSSIMPYRYGLAGLVTSNLMLAGLLYVAWLTIVSFIIFASLKADSDKRKSQNRVLSLVFSFIAAAGISFFLNIIAVYLGVGDFVAFDPPVFFTATTIFEFNLGTILMSLAFLSMWGVGYHEMSQMDDAGKTVQSMSSLALSSPDEAYRALSEALMDVRARGFDM